MRRLVFTLILALGWVASADATIIISEYVEGTANKNLAIELYNYGSSSVDLSSYTIDIYTNGSSTVSISITLSGTLAAGGLFVLAEDSAVAAILAVADQTDGTLAYSGDDAIVLTDGSNPIDRVGQVGFDPGTEWGSGDLSTRNNTIQRIIGANPDPNILNPFSLADWGGWPNDTFGGLGYPGVQVPENPTHAMVLMGLVPMAMLRARARYRSWGGRIA